MADATYTPEDIIKNDRWMPWNAGDIGSYCICPRKFYNESIAQLPLQVFLTDDGRRAKVDCYRSIQRYLSGKEDSLSSTEIDDGSCGIISILRRLYLAEISPSDSGYCLKTNLWFDKNWSKVEYESELKSYSTPRWGLITFDFAILPTNAVPFLYKFTLDPPSEWDEDDACITSTAFWKVYGTAPDVAYVYLKSYDNSRTFGFSDKQLRECESSLYSVFDDIRNDTSFEATGVGCSSCGYSLTCKGRM